MQPTKDLLKIGAFARATGSNLRTLRYYEELGLLQPAARSRGGFRYYRAQDADRVQMIRDLQELGLHLDRIRDLILARGEREPRARFLARVRGALEEQDRLLAARVGSLEGQRAKVALALAKLEECGTCEHVRARQNGVCATCAVTGEALPEHLSALYT